MNDFQNIHKKTFEARVQWRELGRELGVQESDLDAIAVKHRDDPDKCHPAMLSKWITNSSLEPKWRKLLAALRDKTVGREDIAMEIENDPERTVGASAMQGSEAQQSVYALFVHGMQHLLRCCRHFRVQRGHILGNIVAAVILATLLLHHMGSYGLKEPQVLPSIQTHLVTNQDAPLSEPLEHFLGRDREVQDISRDLLHPYISGVRAVGIWGAPAVGKSTVAWYVGTKMSNFEVDVWYCDLVESHKRWVRERCGTNSSVCIDISDSQLSIFLYSPQQKVHKMTKMQDWVQNITSTTLLILDNCDYVLVTPSQVDTFVTTVQEWLHISPHLRLLVTSRVRIPGTYAFKSYELNELEPSTAIELLQLKTQEKLSYKTRARINAIIGNNPLAIHITARLLENTYYKSPQVFLVNLEKRPIETLSEENAESKIERVLQESYTQLDTEVRSCGHHLSLFTGSFSELAALDILSWSGFGSPKVCLGVLYERGLLYRYYDGCSYRYHFPILVCKFFHFKLRTSGQQYDTLMNFNASFLRHFSSMFVQFGRKDLNEEDSCEMLRDRHHFGDTIDMATILPALLPESVLQLIRYILDDQNVDALFSKTLQFTLLEDFFVVLINYHNHSIIARSQFYTLHMDVAVKSKKLAQASHSVVTCSYLCAKASDMLYSRNAVNQTYRNTYELGKIFGWLCWLNSVPFMWYWDRFFFFALIVMLNLLVAEAGSFGMFMRSLWIVARRTIIAGLITFWLYFFSLLPLPAAMLLQTCTSLWMNSLTLTLGDRRAIVYTIVNNIIIATLVSKPYVLVMEEIMGNKLENYMIELHTRTEVIVLDELFAFLFTSFLSLYRMFPVRPFCTTRKMDRYWLSSQPP